MPTLSAISDVIGARLARPRMPSVPKYLRAMGSLTGLVTGCDVARMRETGCRSKGWAPLINYAMPAADASTSKAVSKDYT